MNVFNPSLAILEQIASGKGTFHDTIKSFFADPKSEGIDKTTTAVYVGCVLRHFYVLQSVAHDFSKKATTKCQLALGLAVSNVLWLKRYELDESINFVRSVFAEENVEFNKESLEKFLKSKANGEQLIHHDIEMMSTDYLSQRYNLPRWVAKMWLHNFGKNFTYKIAKSMNKSPIQFVRVNELYNTKEELFAKYPNDFVETELSSSLLQCIGKEQVRRKKYIVTNQAYQISAGLKEFVDKLPIDEFKPCIVYSESYNLVPLELAMTYKNKLKIENLTEPNKDMYLFKNSLLRYKIKGVRTTEATVSQFLTAISDKVGMFVVLPDSSYLDRLRIDPDYFLTFSPNNLDALIAKQNNALEEASKFIEDNGYLAYAVPTINKKEGQNLVESFIRHHRDFELVEEVQHFPFDPTNSTLYYAILRKKGRNEQ